MEQPLDHLRERTPKPRPSSNHPLMQDPGNEQCEGKDPQRNGLETNEVAGTTRIRRRLTARGSRSSSILRPSVPGLLLRKSWVNTVSGAVRTLASKCPMSDSWSCFSRSDGGPARATAVVASLIGRRSEHVSGPLTGHRGQRRNSGFIEKRDDSGEVTV